MINSLLVKPDGESEQKIQPRAGSGEITSGYWHTGVTAEEIKQATGNDPVYAKRVPEHATNLKLILCESFICLILLSFCLLVSLYIPALDIFRLAGIANLSF